MLKSRKFLVAFLVGCALLLACLAAVLVFIVDAERYKQRLENAVSDAVGLEVRVEGPVGVRFADGLHIRLDDVHVANDDKNVASADEVRLGIEFLPLLRREIRIRSVALSDVALMVARRTDGRFNFSTTDAPHEALPAVNVERLVVSNGTLIYDDETTPEKLEATACTLELQQLRVSGGARTSLMRQLSFAADVACERLRYGDHAASDVKAEVKGADGVFVFDPFSMRVLDAPGSGDLTVDFSGDSPVYRVRFEVPEFPLQALFTQIGTQQDGSGTLEVIAELTSRGSAANEITRNASGRFSMRGTDLVLNGIDLDRSLARFESSQTFNLVDAGALFLAGPFGLVATKGFKFASLAQDTGGRSEIRTLVSEWLVERGIARARDVALATSQHRLAARGGLDFVNERFDGLTIALVDAKGCVRVKQELRGPFANAEASKPSIFELIAGPTRDLIERGIGLFSEQECEVFYAGSVASPR